MNNNGNLDWGLMAKYFNRETTAAEEKEVADWLEQAPENRAMLEKNRKLLEKADLFYKSKKFNSPAAWKNIQRKSGLLEKSIQHKNRGKRIYSTFYKYAAVILIALMLGSALYYFGFRDRFLAEYSEITAGRNQIVSEFVLPDGTTVALNSNSQIKFPKKFEKDVREITLTGEAFFDVTPNAAKPFIIHAGDAQVKVLGTSFNVRAYPENESVEVVVKTGKVQVSQNTPNLPVEPLEVVLNPGEKGILISKNHLLEKSFNSDQNFLSWKTHSFVFTETPLNEVVNYLKNVYHAKIELKDEELNDLVLTASFDQKPVEFILDVIKLTFDLNLSEENNQFILSNKSDEP